MSKKFEMDYWLTDLGLERIRLYSNDGMTKEQIARQIGCSLTTLKKYEREHIEIAKAVNAGRDSLLDEVEGSMYKLARGYNKTIVEYEKIERDGGVSVTRTERDVYFPPEFKAQSFILKNRRGEKWDKIKHDTAHAQISMFDKFGGVSVDMGGLNDEMDG